MNTIRKIVPILITLFFLTMVFLLFKRVIVQNRRK